MKLMQKINRLENTRASSSFDVSKLMKRSSNESTDDLKSKFKIHQYTDSAITRNRQPQINSDINVPYFERSIFSKSPSAIEVSLSQA